MTNWSRKQQPSDDPNQTGNPLDPFTAPTMRQRPDHVPTQPLDPEDVPAGEGSEWSGRRHDRLNRMGGSRVYQTNVKRFVQNANNRQLFVIGGVITVLLVLLLGFQAFRGRDTPTSATTRSATGTPARATARPGTTANAAAAGAITLPTAPIDAIPTFAPPPAAAGKAYQVFNTGEVGLRIRDTPSTSGNQIGTFPDGTRVEASGGEQQADGYTWIKVKGAQGEGWVAKDFLQEAQ